MELACADPDDPCPLPYELGADPPLDPVTTDMWQAGLRVFRGTFSAEAIGYWAEVHDDIFNVQPPGVRSGFFQNLERTRRQGVEFAMSLRPHEAVLLSGNLTYTRATFQTVATLTAPYHDDDDDDERAELFQEADDDDDLAAPTVRPGSEFPMVPKIRANIGVEYMAGPWKAGLAVDYVGRQWLRGDEDNSEEEEMLDPYTLVGIRVERSIRDRLTLYLGVSNLFDTKYNTFGVLSLNRLNDFESPRVEAFVTPGPTRRIQGGMRFRF
jgi:outer membrane receptor protein involved in Fe transport